MNLRKLIKFIKKYYSPLIFVVLLIALVSTSYMAFHKDYERARKDFQKAFNDKQRALEKHIGSLEKYADNPDTLQYIRHPFHTHVYVNDSLTYWNTNKVPVPLFANYTFPGDGMQRLQNGWYYSKTIEKDSVKIV